eukprot:scaffold25215_cov48-Isochrysis_galbana.AAC.1
MWGEGEAEHGGRGWRRGTRRERGGAAWVVLKGGQLGATAQTAAASAGWVMRVEKGGGGDGVRAC